jgi:lysophospholipase L1-like esterase
MEYHQRLAERIIGGLLVSTAVALTTAVVLRPDPVRSPSHADDPTSAAQSSAPTNVLFAGDSFTAGAGVKDQQDGYPELIAKTAGLHLQLDAQGGTGFLADGHNTGNGATSRMIDRLPQDGRRFGAVDLLVVDAGRNDLAHPVNMLAAAISAYLSAAREQWPAARIILIFPSFVSAAPVDGYDVLLADVRHSLASVNGDLVNPVEESWYHGIRTDSLVASDKVHPNDTGNGLIATRLFASLRHLGAIPTA